MPEESYVAKIFKRYEKESERKEREAQALYPEEEVVVKVCVSLGINSRIFIEIVYSWCISKLKKRNMVLCC